MSIVDFMGNGNNHKQNPKKEYKKDVDNFIDLNNNRNINLDLSNIKKNARSVYVSKAIWGNEPIITIGPNIKDPITTEKKPLILKEEKRDEQEVRVRYPKIHKEHRIRRGIIKGIITVIEFIDGLLPWI